MNLKGFTQNLCLRYPIGNLVDQSAMGLFHDQNLSFLMIHGTSRLPYHISLKSYWSLDLDLFAFFVSHVAVHCSSIYFISFLISLLSPCDFSLKSDWSFWNCRFISTLVFVSHVVVYWSNQNVGNIYILLIIVIQLQIIF